MADDVALTKPKPAEPRDPLRVVTIALNAASMLAVVGLVLYLVIYAQGQRQAQECFAEAFDELNSSLAVSREISRQDRAELRSMLTSVTDTTRTQEQRRQALDDFIAAIDAAEVARAKSPLPTRTCR